MNLFVQNTILVFETICICLTICMLCICIKWKKGCQSTNYQNITIGKRRNAKSYEVCRFFLP